MLFGIMLDLANEHLIGTLRTLVMIWGTQNYASPLKIAFLMLKA